MKTRTTKHYAARFVMTMIAVMCSATAWAQSNVKKCPHCGYVPLQFIRNDATCTQGSSSSTYVCVNCGKATRIEEYTPPLGHDWGAVTHIDATCINADYDQRTCNRCGATETFNVTPAQGQHSYLADGTHVCQHCGVDAGAISYIDSDGTEHSCADYTFIVGSGDLTLGTPQQTAWYVLYGNVSLTSLELYDKIANLILMDGATLTINNDSKSGLKAPSYGTLNIYAQAGGSGTLNVTSADYSIYALEGINIYGGVINVTDTSLYGLHSYGNITIAGGTVNATGNSRGINSSNNSIILSWTRSSDRIKANSYSAVGSIVLTKAFIDDDGNFHSGTIADAATLAGKTLSPAIVLADNADNNSAIAAANGLALPIQLSDRTLYRDGDWNTLCLPFNLTIAGSPLDGADVRELSSGSLEDGTLTLNFTEATSIEAGKPYLVKWGTTPDLVISSAVQWNLFARNVNSGTESYEGKLVKLGADIDGVATMVGTSSNKFKGIFDGDGHTLDLALVGTAPCTAPFSYVEGATIKNLRTTGIVTLSDAGNYHASGLVGSATGVTIENCRVSMNILFPDGTGTVYSGGLIGHSGTGVYNITNCLFDGSIGYVDGGTGTMENVGGLVGWGDASTPNITYCLNAGTFVNPAGLAMIARGGNSGSITNCYSTTNTSSNGDRYIDAGTYTSATGSDLLALLGDGWEISGDEVVPKKSTIVLPSITNPVFSSVTVNATAPIPVTFPGGKFVGTYSPISYSTTNSSILFLGAENTLYYPVAGANINACRAYFDLTDPSAQVKAFKLNFGEEETETGISLTPNPSPVREGSADAWYDLSGRKISPSHNTPSSGEGRGRLPRGIYIHNGKKVVIK